MLKKISLAAIVALSTSVVTAPPASAFSCPDGSLPKDGLCPDTDVIPTPPAMLAVLGMGLASLRKKNQSNDVDAE